VFEAFPASFPSGTRAELIGNPVRRSIAALPPPRERFAVRGGARPRLLVLGGSQGARILNQILPAAIAALPQTLEVDVWHQAGSGAEQTRQGYTQARHVARVDAFIDDMASAYAWADLVVARAGALTLAELAAAGVGAVLIPYPHATDDHQRRNAEFFAEQGAGIVILENELDAVRLAHELTTLLSDRARLAELGDSARRQARADAADRLAAACVELGEAAG
jgi:UDP-N-acetylglucosamine--N-acetylmuramyl-(pentapeptide) pyrophosphoryl-undecaprenol N-acetylglucosamine transferase